MGLFDFLKPPPAIPPEALCLWVQRRTFFRAARVAWAGKVELPDLAPLNDAFAVIPALSSEQGPIPVSEPHLKGLRLSMKDAFHRAALNMAGLMADVMVADGLCVWERDYAESVAAVLPSIAAGLPIRGRPVLMVPAMGFALAAGSDDPSALERMLDVAERAAEDGIQRVSLRAITWDDHEGAQSRVWLPPEGHPLRARFIAASSLTLKDEAGELYEALQPAARLAHLAALPVSHDGGFVASWFRESDVILPATVDFVRLFDTDDAPLPQLEVDLETLRECLPAAFEPVFFDGEDAPEDAEPEFFRMRGAVFPSPRERAFMQARMAWGEKNPEGVEREVTGGELLAEWDAGVPMQLAPAEDPKAGSIITAPDRRFARVTKEELGKRLEALSAHDQLLYWTSVLTNAMINAMAQEGEPQPSAAAPAADEANTQPPVESLPERRAKERTALLSASLMRELGDSMAEGVEPGPAEEYLHELRTTLDPARLMPIIRPPGFTEASRQNEAGMVASMSGDSTPKVLHWDRLSRPLFESLTMELISDHGDRVMTLRPDLFNEGLAEPAWRSAMLNLEAASIQPFEASTPAGVYVGPWQDEFDASRALLLPRLVERCDVKGDPLLFLPSTARVWLTGSEDVAGITAVLDAIDSFLSSEDATSPYEFRQLLFGWPWVVRAGKVQRWSVPSAHPLAPRISALDERLDKRRTTSAKHVRGFAEAVYRPGPREEGEA